MKRSKTLWGLVAILVLSTNGCASWHHLGHSIRWPYGPPIYGTSITEENNRLWGEDHERELDHQELARQNALLRTEVSRLEEGADEDIVLMVIGYFDCRDVPGDVLILTRQGGGNKPPIQIPLRGAGPAQKMVKYEPGYHRIPVGIYLATVMNHGELRFSSKRLIRIDRAPDCKIVRDWRGITVAHLTPGAELLLFAPPGYDVRDL